MFRLYWLRENGCDTGTLVRADQLEPCIRERVLAATGESPAAPAEDAEWELRLPFIDKREWRYREKILGGLALERHGRRISAALPLQAAIRDRAAILVLTDPVWTTAPDELHPDYFRTWRRVSVALQEFLRETIAEEYFRDLARYEDREQAYTMLVYRIARVNHGKPSTEFTYDLRDYPENIESLAGTWRNLGTAMRQLLEGIETRLREAGMTALSRRYAPIFHEDVVRAVQKRPKPFYELMAKEAAFINSLIDLGAERTVAAINSFSKTSHLSLRKVYGMDLKRLALESLDLTTELLSSMRERPLVEDFGRDPARSGDLNLGL